MMNKIKIVVLGCSFIALGSTKMLAQSGSVAAGGRAVGAGGAADYSIGQLDYVKSNGSGGSVSGGIQQPYEIYVITGGGESSTPFDCQLFPNPTASTLQLNVGNADTKNLSYALFDIRGKLIGQWPVANEKTIVQMNSLPSGTYFLRLHNNQQVVKSFKINKN